MGISFSNIGTVGREQLITSGSNGEPNWSYIPSKGKSTKKVNNRTYQFADEKTKKQIAYMSGYYLQTVPQSVKAAWQETLEETGFNPFQTDVTSILTQLRKVNEMYVPEQLQAGFSDMIDEYVHFNDSARNSIMERMTPDYMVVGIGSKTESYKYKSEIISDETAFYTNEKKEISGICNQFLNGKTDQKLFCNEMKDRLNDYYGSRYELRNQPEAVEGRVNNMLDKLQHMFGV